MKDNGLVLLLLGAGTVLVGVTYYASTKQFSNEKITIVEPVTTFADTPAPMDVPLEPLENTGAPPQGQEFKNDEFKHGYYIPKDVSIAIGVAGGTYILYRTLVRRVGGLYGSNSGRAASFHRDMN